MIAALPFYELRMVDEGLRVILGSTIFTVPTFGIPVDPWATLVCLGILIGLEVSRARALKMGFEPRDIVDGVVFTVLCGFVGAHLVHVLAYYPERLQEEGIVALLKVWQGFSSTGGWFGGLTGLFVFYRFIRPLPLDRMADLIAYGFPIGWFFGRMGCASVHDHIGALTSFPLAVHFPDPHYAAGVRHELGLYEMLAMIPVMGLFWWLGRKDRPPGTFMGLFFVIYGPLRFLLDTLRNTDLSFADTRYYGFTPAQYGVVLVFGFGVACLLWSRRRVAEGFVPWPLDGQPDQAARAAEAPVG